MCNLTFDIDNIEGVEVDQALVHVQLVGKDPICHQSNVDLVVGECIGAGVVRSLLSKDMCLDIDTSFFNIVLRQ